MNAFNNLKVGKKIIIGYIAMSALMGGMAIVPLFSLNNLTKDFTFWVEYNQPVLANAYRLAKRVVDMETSERDFLLTGQEEFLELYHNALAEFDMLLATEKKRVSDNPSQVAVLDKIGELHNKWIQKAAKPEIAKRREANKTTVTAEYLQEIIKAGGVGKDILDEIRVQFDTFIQNENDLNAERSDKAKQAVIQARILILSLLLTSLLIGLVIAVSIVHSITRPLAKLTEMANQIAAGNLNQTVDMKSRFDMSNLIIRQDEMGNMGRAFDALANYFKAVIEDIVQVSQGLVAGHLQVTPKAEYRGDFVQIKKALETALSDLLQVVEDIVQVSKGLAEGNQSIMTKAEYRGDFLQIKYALETTSANLAEATVRNATQDWLKTGQMQLNQQISGEQDIITLAKNIITFLATYLKAQIGIFYKLEEEQNREPEKGDRGQEKGEPFKEEVSNSARLKLIASYAYTQRKGMANEFQIGEGLIGQAALEQQRILVTEVPEHYIQIQSGLGEAVPHHLLVIPFMYETVVKGVIELGFFHALTEVQLEFLDQIMPSIGIAVNTAESRTKMQALLQAHRQLR